MKHVKKTQTGFTIVELMFSMAVFALILLAATAAIIQVGRIYFKGVITSRTQNLTRQVTDEISRAIQFSGSQPVIGTPLIFSLVQVNSTCIGNDRYSYVIDYQVDDTAPDPVKRQIRHGLWQDKMKSSGTCTPLNITTAPNPTDALTDPSVKGRELMSVNMRLMRFDLGLPMPPTTPEGRYTLKMSLIYGDEDLLECDNAGTAVNCQGLTDPLVRATARCKGGFSGISAQFCASSKLETIVVRRLR